MARILAICGFCVFCLRGVLGLMAPAGLTAVLALVLAGAVAFERYCAARGRCPIGELACRQGLLSADRVTHIRSLQRSTGGRFGEIALRERLLSASQLTRLLELQEN